MRNIKDKNDEDIRGCTSCYAGERNYYGTQMESLMNRNRGYYSNSQYYILNQIKS